MLRERPLRVRHELSKLAAVAGERRPGDACDVVRKRRDPLPVALHERGHSGVALHTGVARVRDLRRFRHDLAGAPVDEHVDLVVGHAVRKRLDDELVARAVRVRQAHVNPGVAVTGHDHVHVRAHFARLLDDLAGVVGRVRLVLSRSAGVGEDHDRLGALAAQLGHPAVHGLGDVGKAKARRVAVQQEGGRGEGRDADEAHAHAGSPHDLVRRQEQLAVPVHGVGRDVGEVRTRELGRRGVHQLSRHVRLERLRPCAPAALEQPHQLVAALVELVVAHRADVEADLVRGLDGRLVVEPARDERRGADHVAGMHANGAVRQGRAVEVRLQPGGSSDAWPRRLQVAVEVVHAQQAQLHDAASQLLLTRLRSTRLGVETEQGDERGGDEGGQPGQQSRHGSRR